MTEFIQHGRVKLALHELQPRRASGAGRPLLLLHGLGERSPDVLPSEYAGWNGPVFALDFTGHGRSAVPSGGGYTCELLMGDADAALARLGEATVVGRGLGGYVALLIAGARPQLVRGAVIRDGTSLAGGGSGSTSPFVPWVDTSQPAPPDPFALADLATDIRPPDYATVYARQAAQLSGLQRPVSVCARERPRWLSAVLDEVGVEETSVAEALEHYAAQG
ncbi:MAG: alpha/beta hydrolase [Myxococcales bacterium]|jgi:pimeloyl-ACP methyl ester carboxylesterase